MNKYASKRLDNDAGYNKLLTEVFDRLFCYTMRIDADSITYNVSHPTSGLVIITQRLSVPSGSLRFLVQVRGMLCAFERFPDLLDKLMC